MERKREDAPGGLQVVRSFVNTADLDTGEDQLQTSSALTRWLAEHELLSDRTRATREDVRHAAELREALRVILLAHAEDTAPPADAWTTLDRAAQRAELRLRFDRGGSSILEPEARGVDASLGRLLAIVHRAIEDGTWQRLKACREHSCQWVFYDFTKNRSGAWCTMRVCGNRAKARAYRERHRRG